MDEVWLSEQERRERKDRLRQQRVRHSEREKRIVDAIPKDIESRPVKGRGPSKGSSPPDLVSRSSADDDSTNDSSTLGVVRESEGEMWGDHPSVITTEQAEPEPEPVAPEIPRIVEEDPPSEASEGADGIEESPAQVEQPVDPKPCPRTRRKERSPPKWSRDKDGRLKRKFNFAKMS